MKGSTKCKIIAISMALLCLTACGNSSDDPLMKESKESLVNMVNQLNNQVIEYSKQIEELNNKLVGVYGSESPTAAISEMSDGTGRLTFNSVDDMITLPVPFQYPGVVQSANTLSVNITEAVSFKPTYNWLLRLDGPVAELNHPSGVGGKITVGTLDRASQSTTAMQLQDYLNENFFSQLPPETVQYNRIYVDGNWFGVDAKSHTYTDSKDAQLRCGLIGFGDTAVQYFFVYTGESDVTNDDLISSVINTIQIWDTQILVQ